MRFLHLHCFLLGLIAGMLLGSTACHAQTSMPHADHPQDIPLHEIFYSKWNFPDRRNEKGERHQSCCNKNDCYPTVFKQVKGHWYARRREDGAWVLVPDRKLEQNYPDANDSPDGQSHVCMPGPNWAGMGNANWDDTATITLDGRPAAIFCAVLGNGM